MKNAPATFQEAGRFGEQLALIPDAEIIPARPNPGTLAARLLAMLAAGETLVHPEFEERTGTGPAPCGTSSGAR